MRARVIAGVSLLALAGGCQAVFGMLDPTTATTDAAGDDDGDVDPDGPIDAPLVCGGNPCTDNNPCTDDTCVNDQCAFTPIALPAGCSGPLQTCANEPASCFALCTTAATWMDGEAACVAWGGQLTSLLDNAQTACVGAMLPAGGRAWIGYNQSAAGAEPAGGWTWSSGLTTVDPDDWAAGQPNNDLGNQECAFAQGTAGTWFDHECFLVEHGYICEK